MRRFSLVLLAALMLGAPAAARAASPLRWSRPLLLDRPEALASLTSISCPTVSLCVAVDDSNGRIFTSTDPDHRSARSWTHASLGSSLQLSDISCASASLCVAVGYNADIGGARVVSSTDPRHGTWTVRSLPAEQLTSVACPSVSLCVAVTASGDIFTTRHPPGHWKRRTRLGTHQIDSLSCPSASLCLARSTTGAIESSTDPSGGKRTWRVVNRRLQPDAIDCPSASFCLADGSGFIAASTHPRTGGWRQVGTYMGRVPAWCGCSGVDPNALGPIACSGTSLCVIFDATFSRGPLILTHPLSGHWTARAAPAMDNGTCPSPALCVALDGSGSVIIGSRRSGARSH